MFGQLRSMRLGTAVAVWTVSAASAVSLSAATLCVDPARSGCDATISAAVSHAAAGDTIQVSQGVYKEDVVIGKSLTLAGHNSANTIIDATGLSNGIWIDGLSSSSLSHVTITGLTIENANFEGVLITNASDVTLSGNQIINNDKSLDFEMVTCPGLPGFETAEGFDCGEGVHLSGVTNSLITGNNISNNAGGILISDETGPTHDNLITGNTVKDNVFDCGVTMPSHPRGTAQKGPPFGVYSNAIIGNDIEGNGTQGAGAGVGIFAFLPGARVSDNLIAGNRILNNGIPGVTFHAHSPGENLNNNVIVGNYIAGNGPDDDLVTPGPAGINVAGASSITGTVIAQNVIKDEAYDIVANNPGALAAHWNNLNGTGVGAANLGKGSFDAANNWWGCAQGPNAPGCSTADTITVVVTPWLSAPAVPNGSPSDQH